MTDKTITLNDLNTNLQNMDAKFSKQMQVMDAKFDLLIELVSDLYEDRVNLVRQSDLTEIRADIKIIKLAVADTNNEVKHHTKQIFKLNRKVFSAEY